MFRKVVVDIFVGADVPEKFREEKFLAGLGRLLRVASMKKDTGEKIDGGYVASTKRTPG